MPMAPLFERFRELAFREMRSVIVPHAGIVPAGQYGFLEFYCNEPNCDCRRVLLHVVRSDTGTRVWASINFGWEAVGFYERWFHGDPEGAREMAGATLDPLNPQSVHSEGLLRLFREVVLRDAAYVERLQRHYRLFKGAAPDGPRARRSRPATRRRRGSRDRHT